MKKLFMFLLLSSLAVFAQLAFAFVQDDDVRGAFMTTRPKTAEKPPANRTKVSRRRPKTTNTATSSNVKTSTAGPTKGTETSEVKTDAGTTPKGRAPKIGIGLTLFMRDSNGLSVRVDPSHEFRKGDRVRLLIETNADGYLYIFNTTDGGQPIMIYPDPSLDEAGNYIQAHVPVEVPSSVAAEERLKWFRFDADAGVERLYFVFSREPLSGVPLEDELISFCKEKDSNCPMRPANELWAQVQKEMDAPVQKNKNETYGAVQTDVEHKATTRGIGLSKDDPEPSLVMMTASSEKAKLVTTLDLIHK
jgi:Domain of unknown function (DUF4384)